MAYRLYTFFFFNLIFFTSPIKADVNQNLFIYIENNTPFTFPTHFTPHTYSQFGSCKNLGKTFPKSHNKCQYIFTNGHDNPSASIYIGIEGIEEIKFSITPSSSWTWEIPSFVEFSLNDTNLHFEKALLKSFIKNFDGNDIPIITKISSGPDHRPRCLMNEVDDCNYVLNISFDTLK